MFQITHIQAINFMSFEEISLSLDSKCYVVQGKNNDNLGQESNGSGKTSLVDIIPACLLGQSLTGRNLKDCVKWGQNSFTVKVELINKLHNLNVVISRTVYSNSKSAELVILVNNSVPSTLPTRSGVVNAVDVKAGNEYILNELLCISKEDLLNYYFISSGYYVPFFHLNVDAKTQVISRFSNAKIIDAIVSSLSQELKLGEKEQNTLAQKISSVKGYIEALNDSVSKEQEEKFEDSKKIVLADLNERRNKILDSIQNVRNQINDSRNSLVQLNIVQTDEETKRAIKCLLEEQKNENKEINTQIQEIRQLIAHIENYLAGLITCPHCNHEFSLSGESYSQNDLTDCNELLYGLQNKQKETEESIALIENELQEILSIERKNKETQSQIEIIERKINYLQSEITAKQVNIQEIDEEINNIKGKSFLNSANKTFELISDKKDELLSFEKEQESLIASLSQKQNWIERFSEFKFYLANRPISAICSLINDYLKENESDLNVNIEGFKRLKSGELRADLNPVIYRNWNNPQNYAQFSSGEQCRLNISVDLTFQKLINESSKYGGLDIYINDELLNSCDSLGIKNAATAFNKLNKTIILVSHSGSDLIYDNRIIVEKYGSISRFVCPER